MVAILWAAALAAQCTARPTLNDFERAGFITAASRPDSIVTVHVLTTPGCQASVFEALRALGATRRFADRRVGYIAVSIAPSKVLNVLDVGGIDYAMATTGWDFRLTLRPDTNFVPHARRAVAPVPPITLPIPRVATSLPADGPYFAAAEAGLTQLWQAHPLADGRGVRVALVDEGVDLLHPALRVARDARGRPIPKFADAVTLAGLDENDAWVRFTTTVRAARGVFRTAGHTWTAPHDGPYRFGIFTRYQRLGDFDDDDLLVNPRWKSVWLSVGVLWDERSNRVWVDTDGDLSFRNQRALGDYGITHDIDWFGLQEGDADNRLPFGVKIDRARHAAFLTLAVGGHGAYTAGPLAANRASGGLFDGAAPNAQIVDVHYRPRFPAYLAAFARRDVDVVNWSGGWGQPSVFGDHYDGNADFDRRVLERAIDVYDKPMACACGMSNAVNVWDYQSPEMLRRNRQIPPPYGEFIAGPGWWFTPDGVENLEFAPSTSLVTESRYFAYGLFWEDGKRHNIRGDAVEPWAPPGYQVGANPSPTIPVVSGVLADLISEARRTHVRYNAARLTQAVRIGARRLPGYPTAEQGFGVINAANAWQQLAAMSRGDDPAVPQLTSFTVSRRDSGQLRPVYGFHADEPMAGGILSGELWITRHGGRGGSRTYRVTVAGDDGTYRVLDSVVSFTRGRPVRVRFEAKRTPGLHGAFLQLLDTSANVVIQAIPLGLRVPEIPDTLPGRVERYRATIPPRGFHFFVPHVDTATQSVRYSLRIPVGGEQRLQAALPVGSPEPAKEVTGDSIDPRHHVGPMQTFRATTPNPWPGTKRVLVANGALVIEYERAESKPDPDVPITATLEVEQFAVTIVPDSSGLLVRNAGAAVAGQVEFYSAQVDSSDWTGVGPHGMVTVTRAIPEKIAQWRMSVNAIGAPSKDIDAFVLQCAAKEACEVQDQKTVGHAGATFALDDPAAGEWRIVIRARAPMGGAARYRVREALLDSGTVPGDRSVQRATGESWSLPIPSSARYASFRIDPPRALRIAVTPLTPGLP
ncbi:MAG TPA: hypothetical protein VG454_12445 [Gemmatimonadales bacterium]|nr:hypothetical protein [Gemmatimonadales bacterium]